MRVVIESPYAGNIFENCRYARRAMLHSLSIGESPFVAHLLYTQVLDDTVPDLRTRGFQAANAWMHQAEMIVFYCDYGMSPGMVKARTFATTHSIPTLTRFIGPNP